MLPPLDIKSLKDSLNEYPSDWKNVDNLSFKTSLVSTETIKLDSVEGVKVCSLATEANVPYLKILKIERIHNLVAYHKYAKEKQLMQAKYGEGIEIEKQLFHGSNKTRPDIILESEEGFDVKFAKGGWYGKGIYFSDNFKYSDKFASTTVEKHPNLRQVFLARVLTGKYFTSGPDRSHTAPPINPETQYRYDSIHINGKEVQAYEIFENGRSYPEYLITYIKGGNEPVPTQSFKPIVQSDLPWKSNNSK